MKQQNFLFVDIVSSIFLLILFIANFLGLLYILQGNIIFSALASTLIIICYYFLVQLLAKNKELMFKNKFIHSSSVLWLFYIGLFFVSFVLMSHFVNVEFNAKKQIQDDALSKLTIVDSATTIYKDRSKKVIEDFENDLKTKLKSYKNTGSNSTLNELTSKPYSIDAKVLSDRTYLNVDQIANAKLAPIIKNIEANAVNFDSITKNNTEKYKSTFTNWKRLSLVGTYSTLNDYVDQSINLINEKIAQFPIDNSPIIINYNKENLPLGTPSEFNKKFTPNYILPIIVVLLINGFILIPFFTEKVRSYNNTTNKTQEGPSNNGGSIEL
ncbi:MULTISPECIES: hypothetical protein [Weeksellaceae]|uniref:Uncharacterized protein n=1 Tax=Algoriella xinjiangensis TaxID=684065 RepID=A0A1I4XT11_9FLAO|nr:MULTISPECIES: hypothetical protein [Weeksellaceae]SFN28410.1 hypothetical protein SAMN05421738_109141 [Algoriella xinjiangensis]